MNDRRVRLKRLCAIRDTEAELERLKLQLLVQEEAGLEVSIEAHRREMRQAGLPIETGEWLLANSERELRSVRITRTLTYLEAQRDAVEQQRQSYRAAAAQQKQADRLHLHVVDLAAAAAARADQMQLDELHSIRLVHSRTCIDANSFRS